MPGFLLHQGAIVKCIHSGEAVHTAPNPKVTVSVAGQQQPIVTKAPYAIAGCIHNVNGVASPCLTAKWIKVTVATRVTSNGRPLLLITSQASCDPNQTGVLITAIPPRVRAI